MGEPLLKMMRHFAAEITAGRHMSTTGIGNLLGSSSAESVYKVGLGSNTIRTRSDSSDSGDTVDISDEAKSFFLKNPLRTTRVRPRLRRRNLRKTRVIRLPKLPMVKPAKPVAEARPSRWRWRRRWW